MKQEKRKHLEAAGWKISTAQEFLGLTDDEAAMVPVERLEQMQRAARLHLLRVLEQQPGDLSQEKADQIANEAKHRIRRPLSLDTPRNFIWTTYK